MNIFISYLLPFLLFTFSEASQKDLIEWNSDKRLNWGDFKGRVPVNAANAALTNTAINVEFGFSKKGMTYSIKCRFDKTKSWVRIKNDLVLGHEQGHFDIAELHARKLNKALKDYKFNAKTVSDDVNRIYENIMKDHHNFQSEYDQQTDFSRKVDKQMEWLAKIEKDLKSFNDYRGYTQELMAQSLK
jgi:predicted secreted Zn-dependent protease